MRAKTNRTRILVLVLLGAAVGLILRRWQLAAAYDEAGMILPGSVSTWVVSIFSAAAAAALAIGVLRLPKRGEYEECFSSGRPEMVISVAAAVLVVLGCGLELMRGPTAVRLLVGFLGIVSGLCFAVTAMQRYNGTIPRPAVHLLPCVYLVLQLIVDFKQWSVDPAIQDYCYDLFAAIAAMCAVFHLGGFCVGYGRRRLATFWCLACVIFSAISLTDGTLGRGLLVGGLGLWTGINAWQLLEE